MNLHLWAKIPDGTDVPVTIRTSVELQNPDGTLLTPATHADHADELSARERQGFEHERDRAFPTPAATPEDEPDEDRPLYHPLRYRR